MNHQQWLEWRRHGIGASDAASIMGVSPWKTVDQLWEEKIEAINKQEENDNMRYGKEREEEARQAFESMTGHIVFPDKKYMHSELPWIRATLDGIDLDEKVMVEIKNPNKKDHLVACNHKIPNKYIPQCQHQLFVKNLPWMYYFSYYRDEGIVVVVERDQLYIDQMLEKHHKFWKCVQERIRPSESGLFP